MKKLRVSAIIPNMETREKKPMGRPTLFTEDLAKEFCARLATSSRGVQDICKDPDMPSPSTIFLWLYKDENFSDMYARAKEAQSEIFAQDIMGIVDNAGLTSEEINKARLQMEARKWIAAKLKPKRYGDSTILRGDKDNPIEIGLANMLEAANSKRMAIAAPDVIEGELVSDSTGNYAPAQSRSKLNDFI